jgi:hypothetical protein
MRRVLVSGTAKYPETLRSHYLGASRRRNSQMINGIEKGMRCRTTKEIRTHGGRLGRFTEGTIQGVIDNLGRQLISVAWDSGVSTYVFVNEIEIKTRVESEVSLF